jgi:hypothetical protein
MLRSAFRSFAHSAVANACSQGLARVPKLKLGRGLALVVEPQQGVDVKPYAVGLVSGGVLFGLGRYISNNNRPDEVIIQMHKKHAKLLIEKNRLLQNRKDFGSQEFREDAMNEGIVEAAAGYASLNRPNYGKLLVCLTSRPCLTAVLNGVAAHGQSYL